MIKSAKRLSLVVIAVIAIASLSNALHPLFALTNAGSINALNAPLTENFNSLTTAGTWTDNVTIPGWYSNVASFALGTGSSTTGALYSFGSTAVPADRALGSVASGTTNTIFHGARLTNNTGSAITSLDVSYVGEQWRNGGNATAQTLSFQYQVANAGVITSVTTGTWTAYAALNFTGPIATASAGLLDGNAAANRTAIAGTLAVTVNPGQEVWLRWQDLNDAGNDHGLAIDDFSVTAHGTPVDPAPTVTTTGPPSSANNVAVNAPIVINFSESVNATATAFSVQCPAGSSKNFAQSATPATSITLTPSANLPNGTTCTVTVNATQVTDEDTIDPLDQMVSNYVFSFSTAAPPIDPAPTVSTTNPTNGATGVSVASNITINFSEPVNAGASAFALSCGGLRSFALIGSGGNALTLDPDAALPYSTVCNVTVTGSQVSDVDTNDPDDLMVGQYNFSFTTADPPLAGANVVINEIDADTPGSDTKEFVELFDGGAGHTPLDGLVLVFYTGPDTNTPANQTDTSYAAFDLDGYTTDANGYFTLGNPDVSGVNLVFNPGQFGLLQNGADAVALYAGNASDFPFATPVRTANLLDAIVYGTDDPDDANLLTLLNPGQEQVNENAAGSGTTQSNARCDNGTGGQRNTFTYRQTVPTPGAENTTCPAPIVPGSSAVVISQLYGGGGNSGAPYKNDFVELFNRSAAAVDITGWSLQYASATGSGWDFNKQPLAGTIAPGQYYLISLAGGATGAPLPTANITGGLINMAGASGKIALVDNFDALAGICPKYSVHLKDLVGYGATASCHEGSANAPAGSNSTAVIRKLGGATDTDQNGNDFLSGAPNPRQTAPIVELGPYVVSTDPRADGTDAPRDATIQVTFTEPVDVVDPWFTISCEMTGVHDSYTQAGGGQNHYITPNVNFAPGELCTVTIQKDQVHDTDTDDAAPGSDTMTANHVWSFTVASGTEPYYPSSVHLTMGNPSGAIASVAQPNNYLMVKPEFTMSYNRDYGRPNWVSWHLSSEWFGTLARVDTFRADPQVPADWYRVQSFDFSGSGFDRGHMTPNADRDKETSTPINQATFLMSNMIAQAPDNNQGPWAAFEGYLRDQAGTTNEIYIVSGGVGIGGTGSNGGVTATVANGHVTVPERTWKVALILPKVDGDNVDDVSRVTCATRTIAINMPNTQGIRSDPWENYLTTVDAIEALTGYNLFSNLPPAIQACVEAGTNGNNPPLDSTPPAITCASPDGAWHADNVDLSCIASDSGSGLANAGDASFTLTTSVVPDIEDANASTGTRTVCDVAGNCATAASIVGNKIDRRAPMIVPASSPDNSWHANNVAFPHTASDSGSGLANPADASFSLVTSVAAGIEDANASTDARTVCDAVGNCAVIASIGGNKIDRKGPVITVMTAPDGLWHATNQSFAHTASDGGSGLANPNDASFSLVTTVSAGSEDGNASTDSSWVCDAVNNCTPGEPITGIMVDRKAPVISLITPPDGSWHAANLSFAHTATDDGSGLANAGDAAFSLITSVAAGNEDANASTDARTVCDAVGNCATAASVAGSKIDRKAPVITGATADGLWHATNQSLAHTAVDGGSGLANAGDAAFSLVTSVAAGVEDANAITDARTVCDAVGNCSTADAITGNKIDRKAPVITSATADGVWHADNVALPNTASDGGSGLANSGDASFVLVATVADGVEDANASTNARTVCDAVGNCSTAGPIAGNKIDRRAPSITLTTPQSGAVYQLNRSIIASYGCADFGSGVTACAGPVANGIAIDTATTGVKTFTVMTTDAVGNAAATAVSYSVVADTISISNIPAQPFINGSFVPAFAYAGDGATSVTSSTPDKCVVSSGVVNFIRKGTCTLVSHATATAMFDAATGAAQSFEIGKQPTTISITNIPVSAINGGNFTPVFAYTGDGTTHVKSETTNVCKVNGGVVKFIGAGTCTLTSSVTPNGDYDAAVGAAQSFVVH